MNASEWAESRRKVSADTSKVSADTRLQKYAQIGFTEIHFQNFISYVTNQGGHFKELATQAGGHFTECLTHNATELSDQDIEKLIDDDLGGGREF